MEKNIAVLPGDGIGPEIVGEAVKVLKAVGKKYNHRFVYNYGVIGAAAIDSCGDPYPVETHKLCMSSDAIMFGAIGDPKYDNNPAAKVRPEQGLLKMRRELGLYANIRPVELFPELSHRSPLKEDIIKGVDMVVVRELTGGIYFGEPRGRSEDGTKAFDSCVYSKKEVERISRLAFKMAKGRRGIVTLVDKANVLATSRLWREVVTGLQKNEFPEITLNFLFVDNAAMQLVTNPAKFDVLLTENMFGDILSDQASVLTGSIGLLPSSSFGESSPLFEPIHGSYPQAAGKNIANPIATILSAAMMLNDAFDAKEEAEMVKKACRMAIGAKILTEDLSEKGKSYSTTDVGDWIVNYIVSDGK